MKKINNIKFLIFFIFLFFTATQQIEAYKKTNIVDGGVGESVEVLSYTAPENNEVMAGDNINLSFEILYKPLSIAETKTKFYNSVQLYFIGRVDGVADAPFNVLVDYGTDRLNNLNKVKTISTHDFQVASDNSKATNYSWNLADAAGKKILATGSFTFKTNTKMKGWYNTMKANTSTETIFTVSGPYTSQALCKKYIDDVLQGKDSFTKATNFQYSVYLDCNQYDTRPITPNNIVLINPGSNAGTAVSTTYTFLAPIGDSLTIDTNDIGAYFNLIFKLAIGLCAALAVIMIIIGGVQYMGDESVFGKTEAKDRIIKAILGLLIAVGSWALLNTINPALTGVGGINVANVSVEVEDIPWSYYEPGDNKTGCPSGYRDVLTSASPAKINVCSSIASDLEKLIAAAKSSSPSIILSGSGSRSMATQQALRIKNKCPDIKTPANKCTPKQVAIPGNSNHEKGLAVDFNCNGKSMLPDKVNLNNVCYVWLSKNASKYGLSNDFKAIQETWHWSTTGR